MKSVLFIFLLVNLLVVAAAAQVTIAWNNYNPVLRAEAIDAIISTMAAGASVFVTRTRMRDLVMLFLIAVISAVMIMDSWARAR